MPSGHDPMGGYRFSSRQTRSVCAEIMLKQKDRADDDSKKSHPALAQDPPLTGLSIGLAIAGGLALRGMNRDRGFRKLIWIERQWCGQADKFGLIDCR